MSIHRLLLAAAPLAACGTVVGQTTIDPSGKRSWQENCGWMNWRDADNGAQGVRDAMTFLSGFIWCENIGWINVGDGSPANGVGYANVNGLDFGVNVSTGGILSGMAWGENVGWINFSGGALASPPQGARLDLAAGRFRGYAWGENIGWINLDSLEPGKFVKRACYANCDGSTGSPALTPNDFQCFINKFASADPAANCDRSQGSPALTPNDFQCFINSFAAGCP